MTSRCRTTPHFWALAATSRPHPMLPRAPDRLRPTDVSSNAYNSYNGQIQQYQTQQGQSNALQGGLFGLGGCSALGAGAFLI